MPQNDPIRHLFLPEGASVAASLPGALYTCTSISSKMKKNKGISFDHIFIEAGTGFMACALILGLSWLKCHSLVHVLLLAEMGIGLFQTLKNCYEMFLD